MKSNKIQKLTKRSQSEIFELFCCFCAVSCLLCNLFMIRGTCNGKLKGGGYEEGGQQKRRLKIQNQAGGSAPVEWVLKGGRWKRRTGNVLLHHEPFSVIRWKSRPDVKAIKKRRKEKQEREGEGCFPKGGDVLVYELISLSPSISLSLTHSQTHTPSLSLSLSQSLSQLQQHTHRDRQHKAESLSYQPPETHTPTHFAAARTHKLRRLHAHLLSDGRGAEGKRKGRKEENNTRERKTRSKRRRENILREKQEQI